MLTPQQHREGRATVVLRRSDGGRKLAPRHGFDSPDQVSIRLDNTEYSYDQDNFGPTHKISKEKLP